MSRFPGECHLTLGIFLVGSTAYWLWTRNSLDISAIIFFLFGLLEIYLGFWDINRRKNNQLQGVNRIIHEAEQKRNAYWVSFFFAILIPVLLYLFVWIQLIYLLPVSISMFCLTKKLPPSVPTSSGYTIVTTKEPDLPGTRVLAQVKCPSCGKESDSGNVYCPYCFNSMKKRI